MSREPFHTILVAVDFGEASARALTAAGAIAARCRAGLRILHAEPVDVPVYFTHEQITAVHAEEEKLRAQCEAFLTGFAHQYTTHPFTALVEDEPPADAILHDAASADLVVMGTHGRHGPRRWWLGSVAERVLRAISQPLLIVKATDDVDRLFERVLVHASAPVVGASAMAFARQLTDCFGGDVIDGRYSPIETGLAASRATLLVAAAPQPRHAAWLANIGEPLIRFATVPMLFVPEPAVATAGTGGVRAARAGGVL